MNQVTRKQPAYSPDSVGIGIVHLGLGAFHRAHQAVYLERWLNRKGGGDWGIAAANIRSNHSIVEHLNAQGNRYHVAEFADRERVTVREIAAIRETLFAGDDPAALLTRLCLPTTRIVSLTVSEKGYYLSPATGELRDDAPEIIRDLAQASRPKTAPGFLLEALRRRHAAGLPPFTVLCCDNMPENGRRTRESVLGLASRQSRILADWIEQTVPFPSTMVDRIVPAVTDARRAELDMLIGQPDRAAIACEAFSQWVIEDRFASGRPDWEAEGVEMVADVRPYETMKLRLLNGAHSLLAYVGPRRGKRTVAAAICDPPLNRLIRDYFTEAAASLAPDTGIDAHAYTQSLLRRFSNDALEHQLSQIAIDGSQKLPQRWLHGALSNLEHGRSISTTAAGVAAWMAYVRGRNDAGQTWTVDDPLAAPLRRCHDENTSSDDIVAALLDLSAVFPAALASHPSFRRDVTRAFRTMMTGATDAD